jgi:hypothetical protein
MGRNLPGRLILKGLVTRQCGTPTRALLWVVGAGLVFALFSDTCRTAKVSMGIGWNRVRKNLIDDDYWEKAVAGRNGCN